MSGRPRSERPAERRSEDRRVTSWSSAPALAGLSPRPGAGAAPRRRAARAGAARRPARSTGWAQGGMAAAVGRGRLARRCTPPTPWRPAPGSATRTSSRRSPREARRRSRGCSRSARRSTATPTARSPLGREAAHGRRRIVHAGGDATGRRDPARRWSRRCGAAPPSHRLSRPGRRDRSLVGRTGAVAGVAGRTRPTAAGAARAPRRGAGHRRHRRSATPHHQPARGDAATAWPWPRGPAPCSPTSSSCSSIRPRSPSAPTRCRCSTEALRGEGAIARRRARRPLHAGEHPLAELAPRDVVARAIWRQLAGRAPGLPRRRAPRLGERFAERFPTVCAACRAAGLDPRRDLMPVRAGRALPHGRRRRRRRRPDARSPGLWAAARSPRPACTAPTAWPRNSLLEAVVFGARVAADIAARRAPRRCGAAARSPRRRRRRTLASARAAWPTLRELMMAAGRRGARRAPACADARRSARAAPSAGAAPGRTARRATARLADRRRGAGARPRAAAPTSARDYPGADPALRRTARFARGRGPSAPPTPRARGTSRRRMSDEPAGRRDERLAGARSYDRSCGAAPGARTSAAPATSPPTRSSPAGRRRTVRRGRAREPAVIAGLRARAAGLRPARPRRSTSSALAADGDRRRRRAPCSPASRAGARALLTAERIGAQPPGPALSGIATATRDLSSRRSRHPGAHRLTPARPRRACAPSRSTRCAAAAASTTASASTTPC